MIAQTLDTARGARCRLETGYTAEVITIMKLRKIVEQITSEHGGRVVSSFTWYRPVFDGCDKSFLRTSGEWVTESMLCCVEQAFSVFIY